MAETQHRGHDESSADAVDIAYQAIRRAIIEGTYPAGARLPEEELSERIGVSRTPIRQALRQLEHEGHVELRPRRGAWVSSWTAEDIAEVYGVRAQLESYGARIAANKIGALELRYLEECCLRMEVLEDARPEGYLDELGELNNEFHASLLRATGNRRLMTSLASIVETPLILRVYHVYDEGRRREALRHHREILAALGQRDGEWAQATMRVHILSARSTLLRGGSKVPWERDLH
jgi:DNA-binding GntR family transcriptional regulator